MGPVVLDTNVVIYHLSGQLRDKLDGTDLCVSIISEIELLGFHGLTAEAETPIVEFLSLCRSLDVSPEVKDEAIRLRRLYRLRVPDSIIAASAIAAGAELLTQDKSFAGIPELLTSAPAMK
jgi:hypothetical protein